MTDAEALWENLCKALSDILSEVTVLKYFGGSRGVSLDGNVLHVELMQQTENSPEKLFGSCIQEALDQVGAREVKVVFSRPAPKPSLVSAAALQRREEAGKGSQKEETLLSNLTFDQFVTGPSNNLAVNMAQAVAINPGNPGNNPLFLYGPPGVGKTHLLHAIGNLVRRQNEHLRVLYTTTANLKNEYIRQWQAKNEELERAKEMFREKYWTTDVLLVDDIQYMDTPGFQTEFFNIFNEMLQHGRQIVMTSDKMPREMPQLMERLVDRFQSGLSASVDIPDYVTRYNILKMKLNAYPAIQLSNEVIDFIAKNVTSSVRALEGALSTTINYAKIFPTPSGQNITVDVLRNSILRQYIQNEQSIVQLTCEDICKAVCKHFEVVRERLFGESREREIAIPRQIAMFLCRKLTTNSMQELGRFFNRKHPTISHACKLVQEQYKDGEASTVAHVRAVMNDLGQPIAALD